jgi:hypothetical protein
MNEGAAKEDLLPRKRRGKPQRTIIPPVPPVPEYKPKNVGEYEAQRVKRTKRA